MKNERIESLFLDQLSKLCATEDRFLLAVSGGLDSSVMAHLFDFHNLDFAIAHCNFQLRGTESDADEKWVKNLAENLNCPFFSVRFETQQYADEHKISIQLAARELRYEWLEKIRQEHDYQYIVTAHHLTDSVENVFMNITRGTGIRGLLGIPPIRGRIIRPLLFASRAVLEKFAEEQEIEYRLDASNAEEKYTRNKFRHRIMSELARINPAVEQNVGDMMERFRQMEAFLNFSIGKIAEEVVSQKGDDFIISKEKLSGFPGAEYFLFEWLRPFGFNGTQVVDLVQSIENQSGKLFVSEKFEIVSTAESFVLSRRKNIFYEELEIASPDDVIYFSNHIFKIEQMAGRPDNLESPRNVAFVDFEKLIFPLKIRGWRAGDKFQPLGLGGKKQKLQDFFSNNKLSVFEKRKVRILESAGDIVWIIGWRLDERFKITEKTKKTLKLIFESVNDSHLDE
ncbi:MAG TPA: tRNA lysidine(34) synthetase TilS [Saprospiraceae bacterium]|nr:tRNA lysidine(34) synthetase TilS [Saprospiraceae bacterium]